MILIPVPTSGRQIVHALSGQLTNEYGSGFKEKNLRHMIRFAEIYPDKQIISALKR
ncbi:MAG: hypothetical protein KAW93_05300 [Methanogenium sp.]|nr:hypothetical protein [Methanogenium sp.]